MNTPPRRARFQIHLSTAIVLMFVAGGLIWANVTRRREFNLEGGISWQVDGGSTRFKIKEQQYCYKCGYPFIAIEVFEAHQIEAPLVKVISRSYSVDYLAVVLNFILALVVPIPVWLLCEWLIRWRAARKRS